MELAIILRTCETKSVHNWGDRFVNASKKEIILRCLNSLIKSINYASNLDTTLYIIDDHSPEETLNEMRELTKKCSCKSEIMSLEDSGNSASMKKCYELGMEQKANMIYFVEDDYIHELETLSSLITCQNNFSKNLNNKCVVLAPYDEPSDYLPNKMQSTRVVFGCNRHWRQNNHTTFTMFTPKWALVHYWNNFIGFSQYDINNGITEENTINIIYKEGDVLLFTPLPFLAVHLQHVQPVVGDWQKIWEKYKLDV